MILNLNTNLIRLFNGTYGTAWEITEYNEEGTEEVEVDYKLEDFMKSIADAYASQEDRIKSDLNIDFINSIKFTGKYYNPREYNFKTDELDFDLDVDEVKMIEKVKSLNSDVNFEKYLHDNFTSCDGFMSFTPNNYKELLDQIVTEGDDYIQSISAVISYLTETPLDEIEETVREDWNGNGYYGLDYTVVEPEN